AVAPAQGCRTCCLTTYGRGLPHLGISSRPMSRRSIALSARKRGHSLIGLLLAVVPDIGCELPVASNLLPHHEIFAGDFLRRRPLGLEAECPDLSRRGGPEWLDVEGCEFRVVDLLRHAFPQCLDRGSALHHAGTGWKCSRVFGVKRRDAGEITFVEEIYPFRVHRLNLSLLGERRRNKRGHQGNHRCDASHDSCLLTSREICAFTYWPHAPCSRQPSDGRMTQNITPLFGPTCLGAQTGAPPSGATRLLIVS